MRKWLEEPSCCHHDYTGMSLELLSRGITTAKQLILQQHGIESARLRNKQVIRPVLLRADASSFPWDFEDLPEDLDPEDLEITSSLIHAVAGPGLAEMLVKGQAMLDAEKGLAIRQVLDHGFERLSPEGRDALGPILSTLREQLNALTYGTVNPFSVSQFWTQQFDEYTDWQFARLARTEVAFGFMTGKLAGLMDQYDASEEALLAHSALPPIHPNCMCDVQPLTVGDEIWLYLDTQLEACPTCHALADLVLDEIYSRAA